MIILFFFYADVGERNLDGLKPVQRVEDRDDEDYERRYNDVSVDRRYAVVDDYRLHYEGEDACEVEESVRQPLEEAPVLPRLRVALRHLPYRNHHKHAEADVDEEQEVCDRAYLPSEDDRYEGAEEDQRVKSVKELWDIYCNSVGHNSVLLINLPPDRRGLIHPTDSLHVALLRKGIDQTFARNLLAGAKVKADNVRGPKFAARLLTDNDKTTYYAGKDGKTTADIVFTLPEQEEFDCLMLQEVIELGHRTTRWSVEYSDNRKEWTPIPEATDKQCVGHKWIVRFSPVKARYVRLRIQDGNACPALHTFGVYKQSLLFK